MRLEDLDASVRLDIRRVGVIKERDEVVGNQTRVKVGQEQARAAVQAGRDPYSRSSISGTTSNVALNFSGSPRVKVDIRNIRRSHRVQVLCRDLLLQSLGDQTFQNLLPDVAGETAANDAGRSLSRPEARKFGAFLYVRSHAIGFAIHLRDRNGNLKRVLATFN